MSGLILETETESITFGEDGHRLHTHKTTFAQRRSLNTWPDFQSAKKAVEADLGHIRWGDQSRIRGALANCSSTLRSLRASRPLRPCMTALAKIADAFTA